jgi:SagB-type dehydrogenase family enzyme
VAERSLQDILGVTPERDALWEVFHENSKNWRSTLALTPQSLEATQARMKEMEECLPYPGYPAIDLPRTLVPLDGSLEGAVGGRCTQREMRPGPLSLGQVATLLHHAYGMVRDNRFVPFPPRLRPIPSAGALYPLELYFHSAHVEGIGPGLFHYSPKQSCLHVISREDRSAAVARATLYPETVAGASLVIFITAIFERSTWKYGDRGYRYALLEAGHLGQNLALVAGALGLGCLGLGGYLDRDVDDLLGLDGVTHSTVYMSCVGAPR